MATQITTLTAGYILIQAGHGIPNHAAPKGSQFTDVDTATLYFNKNGLSDWEVNIDVGNTGSTIGINTFSSFSSSTIGQGSVIATTSNDNLTFSGVNLSILVDNTNQILTLSAATPSNYTFTGGTVNGLTNFTNGLSATTISATTFYGNGANLTGISTQDTYLTGGTYSNGTATFTNNTGGTFTVSGFKTSDIFVTGGTYNNTTGVTTFTNNTGGTFTVSGYFKSTDDIYTTGMTFNSSNYNLSITRNDGTSYSQSLAILASDMTITGGTYSSSTGVATFTNNTGGTFTVSGFLTGMTDTYTTGFTYSNNTLTLKRNASQPDLSVMINSMTGLTVNGTISTTTISATTYQNLPTDIRVTGGTYNTGTATFTNNTGGTFTVSGFKTSDLVVTGGTYNSGSILFTNNTGGTFTVSGLYTGYTAPVDVTVTGGTYNTNSGIATFTNNTGGTFTLTGFKTSDLVVTGGTYSNGSATFTNNTGGTFTVSGFKTNDVFVTGGTYSNGSILFTNNTGGTFNVNGLYTGYTTPIDVTVTGGTYSNGTASFTNNTGGTFTVSGFKTSDLVVTGGTYNNTTGVTTFTNNTGGTFTVNGYYTGYTLTSSGINSALGYTPLSAYTDTIVTGGTYSNGTTTFTNNTGGTFNVTGYYTGYTAPIDIRVTGGTYSSGTATFTNNTGGTFTVTGFKTDDVFVTGGTYNNGTATFTNNTGGTFNVTGFKTSDLVVTGGTYSNGSILFTNNTGGTFNVNGLYTGYTAPIDVTVTGGTYSSGTATFTNNTGGTFSVSGFKTDDIYTTGMTFNSSNYNLSITRNDGTSFTQSLAVLASDMTITGGTYNANSGVATFTNNTGGTFSVSGFLTGMTDTYTTGLTFSNNVLTLKQTNNQANLDILINNLSGLTVNGSLSATTFYGNGSNLTGLVTQDTVVTGGTYNSGSILFTNNTGGTFNVNGLYTGYTAPVDVYTTGATYSNNTFTHTNNTGGTFSVLFNTVTGLTVNGNLNVTGLTTTNGITSTSGIIFPQKNLNSSYTATTDDYFLNITGGTLDITLMSAVSVKGKLLVVKNEGYGIVNVLPQIGETIDDRTDVLLTKGNSLQLVSDGDNWVILGYNISSTQANTGVISFTGLSKVSSSTFYVAPVKGFIVDDTTNPVIPFLTYVEYTGGTHTATYVNTATETWVYLTSGGTISQTNIPLTDKERRQNIFLGKLGHADKTSIINAFSQPDFVLSPLSQLRDMFDPINLINEGVRPSANGANLSFNTSAGYLHGLGINFANDTLNPNSIYVSGTAPCTFQYRTQTGGTSSNITVIDPTKYDVGGLATSVSGTKATNQRIYLVQNGVFRIQYGQTVYSTLAQAIAGLSSEPFVEFSNFTNNGILVGVLSVLSSATNLSDTDKAQFFNVSKFGDSAGAAGGAATTTLQQAYNNSTNPEIVINATLDGLTIKNGTGNADNVTRLLEGQTGTNGVTSFIRADGYISGTTFQSNGFNANSNGVTATTVSATTYYNLPTDIRVTGGTYSNGTATFTNNTGGTFTVTGFGTGGGGEANTASNLGSGTGLFAQKSGIDLQFKSLTSTGGTVTISNDSTTVNLEVVPASNFTGGTVNGATNFTNGLSANTFSATTYFNLPTDIRVTGGTYNTGTATFTNNTGGTFTVTGFSTGTSSTDTYLTGGTYSNGTTTFTNNTGGTFTVSGFSTGTTLGTYLTGATYSNNVITFTTNSATTSTVTINTMTGLTINGNLTVTGNTQSIFSGNTSSDLVRITQTGSGNAFVVQDSVNPDSTNFTINGDGDVGIGIAPNNQYKIYMYTSLSAQTNTLYVQNQSSNPSNVGTAIYGNGLSTGVLGYANGNQNPIGVNGYASDGITVIGVSGSAGKSEFGSANTTIGGYFLSNADYGGGSVGSYSVQLVDGTEGVNKVLVSQTADGKANWSATLSGLTGVYSSILSAATINTTNLYVTGSTQSLFTGNSSVELVKIVQNGSGDAFVVEDVANGDASHFVINSSGNVAIGLIAPLGSDKLTISGNTGVYGTVTATNFVGDGSGLTNITATALVPYGLINAISSGNFLI